MLDTHDIFVRAFAVPQKAKKHKEWSSPSAEIWPQYALAFDTESRVTADQSLTFGVYRLLRLVAHSYVLVEEGVFYADDLPEKERKILESHVRTAIPDAKSFPPRFPLHSRSDFIHKVFFPALRDKGAMVVGFNLPYDLARCAFAWPKGDDNEWSLIMSQYPDGNENKNNPRILVQPIDSKKAFIRSATPWNIKTKKKRLTKWKNGGQVHFLDLRTLLWALYNKSYSLRRACDNEDGPFKDQNLPQKIDHAPTGKVTPEEIEYARQDVRCTVGLLNALKQEFDRHPIALKPWSAYSPASVAKAYLAALGILPPAKKFNVPPEIQGIAMQSYFGGRSETKIRRADIPVCPLDFTSQYPSVCVLLGLFNVLTAGSVSFVDETDNIRCLLEDITHTKCFNRELWKQFTFWALVLPDGDVLPVRTVYDGVTQNIGNNYLFANPDNPQPQWFAGPDLIASAIRTGKAPRVIKAVCMVTHAKQVGMHSVKLRGVVEIDPYKDDLLRKIIEDRKKNKANEELYYWLKILANSIYGFFVELNPESQSKPAPTSVFSGEVKFSDMSDVIEDPGRWFCAPLASLITSGGRLLLALA